MSSNWETPYFEEIDVGGECTAYAGAKTEGETAEAGSGAAPVVPAAPSKESPPGR
jgi:coenzyme PQQ precursor peptide PqqA